MVTFTTKDPFDCKRLCWSDNTSTLWWFLFHTQGHQICRNSITVQQEVFSHRVISVLNGSIMEISFWITYRPHLFIYSLMTCHWFFSDLDGRHKAQYHLSVFEHFELFWRKRCFHVLSLVVTWKSSAKDSLTLVIYVSCLWNMNPILLTLFTQHLGTRPGKQGIFIFYHPPK